VTGCHHVWVADDPPVDRDVWWAWTADEWDGYWSGCRWYCVKRCGAERWGRGGESTVDGTLDPDTSAGAGAG